MIDPGILGPLCAFCSSITWAIGSTGYARLSRDHSVFSVNISRAVVALPLLVIATFLFQPDFDHAILAFKEVRFSHWAWFTLSILSSYSLGDALFLWGSKLIGVSTSLAIASIYPLWTVIAGWVFSGNEVSLNQLLGLLITMGGVATVILTGSDGSRKPVSFKGFMLALGSSFLWAANTYSVSRGGADLFPTVGSSVRMVMGLVLCAFFGKVSYPKKSVFLKKDVFLKNVWLFFIEGFLGACLFIYGLSHTPLALGTVLVSLAPVLSVPVAVILGLEKFSLPKTVGICFVILGIWFLSGSFYG